MARWSPRRQKRGGSPSTTQGRRVVVPRSATPRSATPRSATPRSPARTSSRSGERCAKRAASSGTASISHSTEPGRLSQGHTETASVKQASSNRVPRPPSSSPTAGSRCSTPDADCDDFRAGEAIADNDFSEPTASFNSNASRDAWQELQRLSIMVGNKLEKIVEVDAEGKANVNSSETLANEDEDITATIAPSCVVPRSVSDCNSRACVAVEPSEALPVSPAQENLLSDEEAFVEQMPAGAAGIAWIPPDVGDQVLARMEGRKRWYNATITRAWADGSWRIAWDDGDWRDQFKFANQVQLVREGFAEYRVGDKVLARYKSTPTWYMATIDEVHVHGVFLITWNDGDKKDRSKSVDELVPRAAPPAPALKLQRSKGVDKFVPNVPRTRSPRRRVVRKEAHTRLFEDAQRRADIAQERLNKIGRHVPWQCTPGCQQWGG